MKNLFKSMMLVAVAAMGFTACSNEAVEEVNPEVQTITRELIVSSEKPALEGDTRTEFNGETVVWSTGDAIRMVYHSENGWGGKFYASKNAVIEGNKASFAVNTAFEANDGGNYQFYAGYPSTQWNGASTTYSKEGTVAVKIPTEQTMPSANTFNSKGDLLIGKSVTTYAEIPASGESMNFNYTRLVAHGCVTLKDLAAVEGEKVLNVTFTAPADVYLTGSSTADFEAQALTEAFDNNTVTVTLPENTAATENVVVWFCSAPATIASGADLTVEVETDLATYTRTITAREGGIQFLQNRYNTLGINMASAEKVVKPVDTNDYSGDYYILAKRSSGNFWAATSNLGTASPKRYQAVDTGSEDINSVDLTEATVWTIEATTGGYYLKAGNQYAYWTSGNSGNLSDTADEVFTIDANDDGTYTIHWAASDAERYFALNSSNGNNFFAFYKTGQKQDLYLVSAVPDTRTKLATPEVTATAEGKNVTVSWNAVENADSYTLTYGDQTIENATSPYTFEGEYSTTYDFSVVAVPTDSENYKNSAAGTASVTTEADPNAEVPSEVSVTFDFSNPAKYGFTEPSTGGSTDINTGSLTEGSITLTATDGGTATRFWNSSGNIDLRVYKDGGSLTFTAEDGKTITKIEFSGTVEVNELTDTTTWTGTANSVKFTASGTNKISKVVVTYN